MKRPGKSGMENGNVEAPDQKPGLATFPECLAARYEV